MREWLNTIIKLLQLVATAATVLELILRLVRFLLSR